VKPVAPAATVEQPELDEQPALDSSGGFLMELHVCVGLKKPEKCKRGAVLFTQKCNLCHHSLSVQERAGPTLVGLVGRERRFLNGQSLVADRS
jgi:cytochrome c2